MDREITEDLLHEATDRLMDALTALVGDIRGELPTGRRIDVHELERPKTNFTDPHAHGTEEH